ncbi:MAG TPA: thioredoxin fold domain-containing protein [Alphaproteobacteria bacterium]|nr:hypothetical protein [Rhodospirillaceae bacterium]HRJ12862.1 thioredoxin fold domain-containing protein [Alphaproteobacteria bacterium]
MRHFIFFVFFFAVFAVPARAEAPANAVPVAAPEPEAAAAQAPEVPAAIAVLLEAGSTAQYVGEEAGYQAWLLIGPGQKQVSYIKLGENTVISGTMTDEKGENMSARQLLQAAADGKLENIAEITPETAKNQGLGDKFLAETAALRTLAYGPSTGKTLYVFMDPNCPYCHQFDKAVRDLITAGKSVQLLVIPAPILGPDSRDKAVRIYGAASPTAAWEKFMADGTLPDLPTDPAVKEDAEKTIAANLHVMSRWKLPLVPMIIWRGADGRVMMSYGTPKDMQELLHNAGIE